jgi:hypothetical protein
MGKRALIRNRTLISLSCGSLTATAPLMFSTAPCLCQVGWVCRREQLPKKEGRVEKAA